MITDEQIEAIAAKLRAKDHPEYSLEDALADAARIAVASCPRGDGERQKFVDAAMIAICAASVVNEREGIIVRQIAAVEAASHLWQAREADRPKRMKGCE